MLAYSTQSNSGHGTDLICIQCKRFSETSWITYMQYLHVGIAADGLHNMRRQHRSD